MELAQNSKAQYVLPGEATDQETIIRLRKSIEEYVREEEGINFSTTELFWEMNQDKGTFNFELHFFK